MHRAQYCACSGLGPILFLAISSSDKLRLGIRLGLGLGSVLIAGLTSTFRTLAKFISQWLNNITR